MIICEPVILFVVLRGSETWSMKPRKQHQLILFKNRVLWRLLGCWRGEVTGGWRKLCDKINDYCCLPDIINVIILRKMGWLRHVMYMEKNKCIQNCDGKT